MKCSLQLVLFCFVLEAGNRSRKVSEGASVDGKKWGEWASANVSSNTDHQSTEGPGGCSDRNHCYTSYRDFSVLMEVEKSR